MKIKEGEKIPSVDFFYINESKFRITNFYNFSTISLERLPTSLKFVVFGIIKPSSFLKSSISALCLSK